MDEQLRAEVERLSTALHAAQRHPDYRYAVTFVGNTAHKPMDEWERNPEADSRDGYPAMIGWRRRRETIDG